MASTKERQRWERWFVNMQARVDRQRDIITRLVNITTESVAALEEIAGATADAEHRALVIRAREALERIKGPAAATLDSVEANDNDDEPEDPRSNQ